VIREAIRKEGMVALGKVVFTSREHIIALGGRMYSFTFLR
jgi:non-homologous end joining protein Ku